MQEERKPRVNRQKVQAQPRAELHDYRTQFQHKLWYWYPGTSRNQVIRGHDIDYAKQTIQISISRKQTSCIVSVWIAVSNGYPIIKQ